MDKKKKTTLDKLKLMKSAIGIGAILSASSCGQYEINESSENISITSEQVTEDTTLADVILETLAPESETVSNITTAVKEEVLIEQSTNTKKVSTTSKEEVKVEVTTKSSSQTQKPSNSGSSNNGSTNNNLELSREEISVVTTKAVSKNDPVVTTKKATTKPTPIKTQPVTDTPTEPPVIYQPEEYTLDMIKDNPDAFYHFAGCLNWDVLQDNGVPCSYADVTFGGRESRVALAIMNDGEISDSVLQQVFADYSKEELVYGTEYLYSIRAAQMMIGTDVDYSKYICDQEISEFLNEMDDVYRSGNIDAFIREKFIDGNNISEKCLYHLGVLSIGCSYDYDDAVLTCAFVDNFVMNDYIDSLYEKSHGKSYTR